MPDFMTLLSSHNAKHGIHLTFSELKKTARRIERAYDERSPTDSGADPYAYVLQYADPTGETASLNADAERACSHASAARRLAAKAAV